MTNLFGEPYTEPPKKRKPPDKERRAWENAFQKWSNEHGIDGYTHYGACGFGVICDYCKDNSYGRPCVRALNEYCRVKRKTIDYSDRNFERVWDNG